MASPRKVRVRTHGSTEVGPDRSVVCAGSEVRCFGTSYGDVTPLPTSLEAPTGVVRAISVMHKNVVVARPSGNVEVHGPGGWSNHDIHACGLHTSNYCADYRLPLVVKDIRASDLAMLFDNICRLAVCA